MQQTEWAFVVPPALRTKSRYLNLGVLLRWAAKARALLELPEPERARRGCVARLEKALGWLREMGGALAEWGEWLALSEEAVRSVRQGGLHSGAAKELAGRMSGLARADSGRGLARTLVGFVREQKAQAKRGGRLVASTEVLESLLGRYEALAREHSKGGVAALALGTGALLGAPGEEEMARALVACSTADVRAWVKANLAPNAQKQRCRLAPLLPRRKRATTNKDRPAT